MKIELLYILDCLWCVKTKEMLRESLEELKVKATIKEILIDSKEKAKRYGFVGSPTIKINGKDIGEEVRKDKCLPCSELIKHSRKVTKFVEKECNLGCRIYLYKNKQYPYPPKSMIKEAIKKNLG
jgi:glutaredoxin